MRYQGMQYFAQDLNRLKISKWMKTKVVPQKGYVPPPLVGIWARWPYLHNNSIPSLCALMPNTKDRPENYWAGPAIDENTDYDHECVGYPSEEKVPHAWRENPDYFYDTSKEGLSNQGHFYRIFTHEDGTEKFTQDQKRDLIEFLKTL
mgnify:FL=1